MFPSNQNISQFIGGNFTQPDVAQAPSASAPSMMQGMSTFPSSGSVPPTSSLSPQAVMLNAMMKSIPNSGTNHSIGNGGWSSSFSPNFNNNQQMLSALGMGNGFQ